MRKIALAFLLLSPLFCDFQQDLQMELSPKTPPKKIADWMMRKQIIKNEDIQPPTNKKKIKLTIKEVVYSTLHHQWDIQIARKIVEEQKGQWQQSKGAFNPLIDLGAEKKWLLDAQQLGFKTTENGHATKLLLSLTKQIPLGTRFSFQADTERIMDPSNSFDYTNQSKLSFFIQQPLFKSLKYNEANVARKVDYLELKALRSQLYHTISFQIFETLSLYWDLVAFKQLHRINRSSYHILSLLTKNTEKLIEGGFVAKAEINKQMAELLRQKKAAINSQQLVYESYNLILFEMGKPKETFDNNPPDLELQEFPPLYTDKEKWSLEHLLQLALESREDLKAATIRLEETEWQLRFAKNQMLPTFDLQLGVNVKNNEVDERARPFFAPFENGPFQKDIVCGFRFSIPLFNDAAKGQRTKRRSQNLQAVLEKNRLLESIRTEIANSYRNQMELIDEVVLASEAVEWYKQALKDEIKRRKEGHSTFFIVIDAEENLRNTLIEKTLVQNRLAKNSQELLFLTGQLVSVGQEEMVNIHLNFNPLIKKDEK
ncbi:MAG: hypothetical protein K940chlam8_00865 [Chlamydiae bacterium]|nr:hypothetical protein [Chlamydiota bacterium]